MARLLNGFLLAKVSVFACHLPLDFNHYIHVTIAKAMKVLRFIKSSYKTCISTVRFRMFYFVLVRSIFKYEVIDWHSYFAEDTPRLKRIQNKFLSRIAPFFLMSTIRVTPSRLYWTYWHFLRCWLTIYFFFIQILSPRFLSSFWYRFP